MAGFFGVTSKLGWGSVVPVTDRLEFMRDTVACRETLTDLNAISGRRGHTSARKEVTRRDVGGDVEFLAPTAVEWSKILPRAFGAAASGTTYALAETLPEFNQQSDRGLVHAFTGLKVNRLTITAREGGGVSALVNLIGKDETDPPGAAGTFPIAGQTDTTTRAFILPQGAVTIGGSSFQVDGVQAVFDNFLVARFANSIIATDITPTDRRATIAMRVPWGDFTAKYVAGAPENAIVVTFTNGAVSLSISMPSVRWPKQSAPVEDKGEEWYSINGEAGIDAAGNPEVTVTLDSTP
jgi:hypothetical protein